MMSRDRAIAHVERILTRWGRFTGNPSDAVCSIETWSTHVAPLVAEVDWHNKRGGASYMQVDLPLGLAVCAQVERWLVALMEGWPDIVIEERRRLAYLLAVES